MRHFNAPPGWPEPPNARWRPPKRWSPDESWSPAPPDWPFWVDGDGRRVSGPLGRYGGPSLAPLVAPAGGLVAVLGLVLFVLLGPFGGSDATTQRTESPAVSDTVLPPPPTVALPTPGESTSEVTPTVTPTPVPTPVATPSPTPSTVSPTIVPTPPPTTLSTAPTPAAEPVFYKNCPAVRRAGLLVLLRGMPGYSLRLDPDGDGIACDRRG